MTVLDSRERVRFRSAGPGQPRHRVNSRATPHCCNETSAEAQGKRRGRVRWPRCGVVGPRVHATGAWLRYFGLDLGWSRYDGPRGGTRRCRSYPFRTPEDARGGPCRRAPSRKVTSASAPANRHDLRRFTGGPKRDCTRSASASNHRARSRHPAPGVAPPRSRQVLVTQLVADIDIEHETLVGLVGLTSELLALDELDDVLHRSPFLGWSREVAPLIPAVATSDVLASQAADLIEAVQRSMRPAARAAGASWRFGDIWK